jgi:ATP-dependent phosphofructokinase / diphosphate-dependent phosphofructokinase
MTKNVLIVQSGGPTTVINQTMLAIAQACHKNSIFGTVFGAKNGLDGILNDQLYNLSRAINTDNIDAFSHTTGALLGTARLKPKPQDFIRIFEVIQHRNIGFIFYIGGNDSAEAAYLIQKHALQQSWDLQILHLPKTIDNDLLVSDHSPGYPSAAKLIVELTLGELCDSASFQHSIKINIVMGRHAGWLTAASMLATKCIAADNPIAHTIMVLLPENTWNSQAFIAKVQHIYDTYGSVLIMASEGMIEHIQRQEAVELDEFGNAQLSGSHALSDYLTQLVKTNIKSTASLRCRSDTYGYFQRSLPFNQSHIDTQEAHAIGVFAVEQMALGANNQSVALYATRNPYKSSLGLVPMAHVSRNTQHMPDSMRTEFGVTAEFYDYALPLVGHIPTIGFLPETALETSVLGRYSR